MIKGLGPKKSEYLKKLGIYNEKDLLYHFPRYYEDRSEIKKIKDLIDGESSALFLEITSSPHTRFFRKGMNITKMMATDGEDFIEIIFFNQPYLSNQIKLGDKYYFFGKIEKKHQKIQMNSPLMDKNIGGIIGNIVPVYSLTKGISHKDMLSFTLQALDLYTMDINELLPKEIREKYNFLSKEEAIRNIHRPKNQNILSFSQKQLIYEEFFIFSLAMGIMRKYNEEALAEIIEGNTKFYLERLNFKLTDAQRNVLKEILEDMKKPYPMNRLLQGDVGSGKTIIAFLAMTQAYEAGYQSVFMAPTEILAKQHYLNLIDYLEFSGVRIALLTGSTPKKEKDLIKEQLKYGTIDMLISTHAALVEDVIFSSLALVITDEQHRFGVSQRANLVSKGKNPHVLIMSATPIPRTIALLLYGDLDISTIDELPAGRIPVETIVISKSQENRMAKFINENINRGRQAFIICPLIDDNENLNLESVTALYERIKKQFFFDREMAFLHGQMLAKEKEKIMNLFSEGKIDILVSTTVVEVGIDIPNANIMAIYNAERFGLAQLHQLRGRVGRGNHKSYCILINDGENEEAYERMRIMQMTNDGFLIASEDLKMRGGGDVLGTRQHGKSFFNIGDIHKDRKIFEIARDDAKKIIKKDPNLLENQCHNLRFHIEKNFIKRDESVIFN